MTRAVLTAALAAALALPALTLPAAAAPKGAGAAGCPPGLAKKSPACVPPGLAKKAPYARGDRITRDYTVLRDPRRYGLDADETYYNAGGYIFRVDRETREVLDLIGAIAAVLD